jgi:hypothetical protein
MASKSEAPNAGVIKSALLRFATSTATTTYTPADFGDRLLACFGWEKPPDGAQIAAELSVVENAKRTTRTVALVWKERSAIVDVVKPNVALASVWPDVLRVCLQLSPCPQYALVTNQRDVQFYDLKHDKKTPRATFAISDLSKYSEALPFLAQDWTPGTTPRIINVAKVSRDVADLVAQMYRSLVAAHPKRKDNIIQFTLQCITAMFAEDIGLLPENHFTKILYGSHEGVERRIGELFTAMCTKHLPEPRVVRYFNGGLFTDVKTLPLNAEQLSWLRKAAESNWRYVDPHIFGSVFQGIMDDAERHASGAHYTAMEDIMAVVGPTIVEPWRKRIRDAGSLTELMDLRTDLHAFRVLDPACGSGNFLYVAFREMYKLDTELLARILKFTSAQKKTNWSGGIPTTNFFGLDINPFAVALAKVTLNIAKKIAFDERKEVALEASGQVVMEIDPSLPLDNLDDNILCADALFTEWPPVNAIVGNPPILGDRKIRGELGKSYLARLQRASGIPGVVDLSCYWFRRAHLHLAEGGRAGLISTSGIRVGKAREATLDYIVDSGGTITDAVSHREWPGEAAVDVSIVNWIKGPFNGPRHLIVDETIYALPEIPTHLQMHTDVSAAQVLDVNNKALSMRGVTFGHEAFIVDASSELVTPRALAAGLVRPVISSNRMMLDKLTQQPEFCIHLGSFKTEAAAKGAAPAHVEYLRRTVRPTIKVNAADENKTGNYAEWLQRWWQPLYYRADFFATIPKGMHRLIVCASPQARGIYAFISTKYIPSDTMQMFAFDDDYSFGIIQSDHHWRWTKAQGGKVSERIRYTADVWKTFPWPQAPTEEALERVAAAARALRAERVRLMRENGWSLRGLYQAAEVPGSHPLKDAHSVLDNAVSVAYGMPEGEEPLAFLLELNQCVAEDAKAGRPVIGCGLPNGFRRGDPRWSSDDCIEPPPNK